MSTPELMKEQRRANATGNGTAKTVLPRPDCETSDISDRSSKRRGRPQKRHKCLEPACDKRFPKRQNLDRHIENAHRPVPTRVYHCTVDGCKYASTGEWRKNYLRADQIKEHIKDYGHYGPHSAYDRPRRREIPLPDGHLITIYFEEWAPSGEDSSGLEMSIRSCEYKSSATKLWHEDAIGDQYILQGFDSDIKGFPCQKEDCHYSLCPSRGLRKVFFKSTKALQEHYRRAHEPPESISPRFGQLNLQNSQQALALRGVSKDVPSPSGAHLDPYNPDVFNFDHESLKFGNHEADSALEFGSLEPYNRSIPSLSSTINPSSITSHTEPYTLGTKTEDGQMLDNTFDPSVDYAWESFLNSVEEPIFSYQPSVFGANLDTASIANPLPSNLTLRDRDKVQSDTAPSSGSFVSPVENAAALHRYKCYSPGCNRAFKRKADKVRHEETVHNSGSIHFCPVSGCERSRGTGFQRKDKLREHMQRKHHDLDAKKSSSFEDEFLEDLSLDNYNSTLLALNEVAVKK